MLPYTHTRTVTHPKVENFNTVIYTSLISIFYRYLYVRGVESDAWYKYAPVR